MSATTFCKLQFDYSTNSVLICPAQINQRKMELYNEYHFYGSNNAEIILLCIFRVHKFSANTITHFDLHGAQAWTCQECKPKGSECCKQRSTERRLVRPQKAVRSVSNAGKCARTLHKLQAVPIANGNRKIVLPKITQSRN